jgi:uncharacterized protein YuzE
MTCPLPPTFRSTADADVFVATVCAGEPDVVHSPADDLRLVFASCGHLVAVFAPVDAVAPGVVAAAGTAAPLVTYDPESDMGYIYLSYPAPLAPYAQVVLEADGLVLDVDDEVRLIGIELFNAGSLLCDTVQRCGADALAALANDRQP